MQAGTSRPLLLVKATRLPAYLSAIGVGAVLSHRHQVCCLAVGHGCCGVRWRQVLLVVAGGGGHGRADLSDGRARPSQSSTGRSGRT